MRQCRRTIGLSSSASTAGKIEWQWPNVTNLWPYPPPIEMLSAEHIGNWPVMATIGREGCTGVQAVFVAKTSSVRLSHSNPGHSHENVADGIHGGDVESMPSFRSLLRVWPGVSRSSPNVGGSAVPAHKRVQVSRWEQNFQPKRLRAEAHRRAESASCPSAAHKSDA